MKTERLIWAWDLRLRGLTEQQIADQAGVTQPTVSRWLHKAFTLRTQPVAGQILALELDKLEALEARLNQILARAHYIVAGKDGIVYDRDGQPIPNPDPELKAIEGIRKILADRATRLGLNAPTKQDVNVTTPALPDELAAKLAAAREATAARKQQLAEETPA